MLASAATAAVIAAAVFFAAAMLWTIVAFNRLVRDRNLVREGWSGIDVQLTRRHNLVPNLVEAVKGYSGHERGLLEKVAAIRVEAQAAGSAGAAGAVKAMETGENVLTDQLRRLFALVESYPDLKADASFRALMEQLAEVEDQLQSARRYYNGAVRTYNTRVEQFPGNLVAGMFHFKPADFFEVQSATERATPQVEFPV
jgi:LemA protein